MGNAITPVDSRPAALSLPEMKAQFTAALQAGILPPHVKNVEQAIAIAVKGQEMGFKPYQALEAIIPIQGRYTVGPEALLSLAYEKVRGFVCEVVKSDEKGCTVAMGRDGKVTFTASYTMEDAKRAGLAEKDNYRKHPTTMLRWRALGVALKVVCPDIRRGLPTPEEAEETEVAARVASVAKADALDAALDDTPKCEAPIEATFTAPAKADEVPGFRRDIDRLLGNGGKPEIVRVAQGLGLKLAGRKPSEWTDTEVCALWDHAGPLGGKPIPAPVDPVTLADGTPAAAALDSETPF